MLQGFIHLPAKSRKGLFTSVKDQPACFDDFFFFWSISSRWDAILNHTEVVKRISSCAGLLCTFLDDLWSKLDLAVTAVPGLSQLSQTSSTFILSYLLQSVSQYTLPLSYCRIPPLLSFSDLWLPSFWLPRLEMLSPVLNYWNQHMLLNPNSISQKPEQVFQLNHECG